MFFFFADVLSGVWLCAISHGMGTDACFVQIDPVFQWFIILTCGIKAYFLNPQLTFQDENMISFSV